MGTLLKDLRFALRMFSKRPGFSAVLVLSLALGIGANGTIFSLVNGILLRPLPGVEHPDELVGMNSEQRNTSFPFGLSYPDYRDLRERLPRLFSAAAAYDQVHASLSAGDRTELVYGYIVSGSYFPLLGAHAERGRLLGPEDDERRGGHPVAVISHGLWERRFGADPNLIGRPVKLNGFPFTVVGIAPPGFIGTEVLFSPDLWVPLAMYRQIVPAEADPLDRRDRRDFRVVARRRPGVSLAQARAQVSALARELARQYPTTNDGISLAVVPESEARLEAGLGNVVSIASGVLLALVGMVLLIACANVANLLLSQSAARTREVCVRLAIGASRRRLIRQLLTESVLLALAGGLLGLLIADWMSHLMSQLRSPSSIPFAFDFSLDHRVLLYMTLLAVLSGLVFGLAPALQASRLDLVTPLRGEAGATSSKRRSSLRSALVIAQVAISLPLLIGAALLLRSLNQARQLDLGFEAKNVLTLSVDLSLRDYSEAAGRQFYRELEERVRRLPGVKSAVIGGPVPLDFYASGEKVAVPGSEAGNEKGTVEALYSSVQPGYFETLGIPLLAGRTFDRRDNATGAPVVVVNEAMAKRFWPQKDPIGRQIRLGGLGGTSCQVVGVVKTGKYRILAEPPLPYFYRPFEQSYKAKTTLVVKTFSDPASLVPAVGREVRSLDENLPVFDVRSLDQLISGRALLPFKVMTTLASAFGLLGLILAAVGLYAVQSYSVAQRTREIGLRMAMGARSSDVLLLVLRQGLTLTAGGLVVGLAIGLLLGRVMARLLLGVSPTDPWALGGVVGMLLAVAILASFVPARRAGGLDPAETLRYE
ncbi:MAG TPA: ABC transporter permease [Thermoanaerobaculia bacterium]|nr:ABC transporter permease [Thermoanaerobaculia bacterium]